jgi:hypothetical protein
MNIPDPKTFTDPDKLRKLMANAVRLGYDDLAFGCQMRIAELAGNAHEAGVERAFWTGLVAAEEFRTFDNGRSTKLIKVRARHKKFGAVRVLSEQMMTPDLSDGFAKLVAHNRSDLTGEAIVLAHEDEFSIDVVNAARKKLMDQGVAMGEAVAA